MPWQDFWEDQSAVLTDSIARRGKWPVFHRLNDVALRLVEDADEEVYDAFIDKPKESSTGLGFLSSKDSTLTIEMPSGASASSREVQVHQSPSSLKSRSGDTGSVLWRVSVLFADFVLSAPFPIFDSENYVYELGAGTGFLASALSPTVARWTCSDLSDNLKLIKRTLMANSKYTANVHIEERDWTAQYKNDEQKGPDVVLGVDVLFNESLLQPFVRTVKQLCPRCFVLVQELRSAEVHREFLETALREWTGWKIYALNRHALPPELGNGEFVIYVAYHTNVVD
ncbi:hypothetical protein BT69DRAFT_1348392 [Atractiella rhizophila]|nr:hypothetical protein BT69DRAFT_1348392 [Atractiella rhizophila]